MRIVMNQYADGDKFAVETATDASVTQRELTGQRKVGARISAYAEVACDDNEKGLDRLQESLEYLLEEVRRGEGSSPVCSQTHKDKSIDKTLLPNGHSGRMIGKLRCFERLTRDGRWCCGSCFPRCWQIGKGERMQQAYIVTGVVTDERTLALDEALPLKGGRVRVVVEALGELQVSDHVRFMAEMRERQRQRGHVPRTREEVDASLKAERESWDD